MASQELPAISDDIEKRVRNQRALDQASLIFQEVMCLFLENSNVLTLKDCSRIVKETSEENLKNKFKNYYKEDKAIFEKDLIQFRDHHDILFACDVLSYFFIDEDARSPSLSALEKLKELRNLHQHPKGPGPEPIEVSLAVIKFLKYVRRDFKQVLSHESMRKLIKLDEEDAKNLLHAEECVSISSLEEDLLSEQYSYSSARLLVRAKTVIDISRNIPGTAVNHNINDLRTDFKVSLMNSVKEAICDEARPRITILVGASGFGKSYTTQQIIREWIAYKGEKNVNSDEKLRNLIFFNLILFVNCSEVRSSVFEHWKNRYPHIKGLEMRTIQALKLLIIIDDCDCSLSKHRDILESIIVMYKNARLLITNNNKYVDSLCRVISCTSRESTESIIIPGLTLGEVTSLAEENLCFLTGNETEFRQCQSEFDRVSWKSILKSPLEIVLTCIICVCAVQKSLPIPSITTRTSLVSQFFTFCPFASSENWRRVAQNLGEVAFLAAFETIPMRPLRLKTLDDYADETHYYMRIDKELIQDNEVSDNKLAVWITHECFLWRFTAEFIAENCRNGNSEVLERIERKITESFFFCRRFKDTLLPLINSLMEKNILVEYSNQVGEIAKIICDECESEPLEFWGSFVKEAGLSVPIELKALVQNCIAETSSELQVDEDNYDAFFHCLKCLTYLPRKIVIDLLKSRESCHVLEAVMERLRREPFPDFQDQHIELSLRCPYKLPCPLISFPPWMQLTKFQGSLRNEAISALAQLPQLTSIELKIENSSTLETFVESVKRKISPNVCDITLLLDATIDYDLEMPNYLPQFHQLRLQWSNATKENLLSRAIRTTNQVLPENYFGATISLKIVGLKASACMQYLMKLTRLDGGCVEVWTDAHLTPEEEEAVRIKSYQGSDDGLYAKPPFHIMWRC
ncbi:uncharacterized protein LOC108675690 [Hyalella azteca]|uniref:Uncharacterized protein LOC108675690 n=1 Tax=Hyalella azteca TaxID=294128 RepID=A0A8B7NZF2_HYAAZ|nr:uncharacterized protein LOC108675690 [Hyalella azteca]